MVSYKLFVKPSALREIERMPKIDRRRVIKRVEALANDPRPLGSEKLSGEDKYRIRQGNYRIVYAVADREQTVVVVKVAHRKDVYRKSG